MLNFDSDEHNWGACSWLSPECVSNDCSFSFQSSAFSDEGVSHMSVELFFLLEVLLGCLKWCTEAKCLAWLVLLGDSWVGSSHQVSVWLSVCHCPVVDCLPHVGISWWVDGVVDAPVFFWECHWVSDDWRESLDWVSHFLWLKLNYKFYYSKTKNKVQYYVLFL